MIKLSDYVVKILVENDIKDVFLVTGGGAMHLNDSIGRNKQINYICCHHEQACAIAAESYFRLTNRLAAVNVTTGPGGTNAITGVWGAWVDSLGMVVISGQVKYETVVRSTSLPLRQLGDQEIDITKVVESFTKYAVMVTDPNSIRYHLEKAIYLAKSGRPGPVWLDIPMNVQGAMIEPRELKRFDPSKEIVEQISMTHINDSLNLLIKKITQSKRPVFLLGAGVRLSHSVEKVIQIAEKLNIPMTTAWNCHDLIWDDHPLYAGRPGTVGERAGNFAIQNSDLLIVLGSRLNIRQISYNWNALAREAFKVMVDIDGAELKKPTLKIDLPIHADLALFLDKFEEKITSQNLSFHFTEWVKQTQHWLKKYPVVIDAQRKPEKKVNPYYFTEKLFELLPENQIVVTGDGTACVTTFQAAKIKKGQRLYTNSGCASMGYDLPAALGACIGSGYQKIICLAGDGSIQMNLQELQTIRGMNLPIKIFILNNQGYHSIRQTQNNFFPDNEVGCGIRSGVFFASFEKLANAFDFKFTKITRNEELNFILPRALEDNTPAICEIILDLEQQFSPKVTSKKLNDGRMVTVPLEDMAPFLERDEFLSNMFIQPVKE